MFWQAVSTEFKKQKIVFAIGILLSVSIYVLFHIGPWRCPALPFDSLRLLGSLLFLGIASCAGIAGYWQLDTRAGSYSTKCLLKLAVAAFSITTADVLILAAITHSFRLDWEKSILDSHYPDFWYIPPAAILFSGALLVYACSVLFTLLSNRRLFSAPAGFGVGTVVLFSMASFWLRLDYDTIYSKPLNSNILLGAALLLLFSWVFSSRLVALRTSLRVIAGTSAVLIAALASTALMCLIRPSTPIDQHMRNPILSPVGTAIVADGYGARGQIRTIPTRAGGNSRIIRRHAYWPDFSPDGHWSSYISLDGIFGLHSFRADLRAATIDGTEDKTLLPSFALWDDENGIGAMGKAFSPDSKSIALLSETMICVVDMEGQTISRSALRSNTRYTLLGWQTEGSDVLLVEHKRRCIESYNPGQNQFRTVYRTNQNDPTPYPMHSAAGIRYILFGNELVDTKNSTAQSLSQDLGYTCTDISNDQTSLIYSTTRDSNPDAPSVLIRRFSIRTGRDELIAQLHGDVRRIAISPNDKMIAIELYTGSHQSQTLIIERNSVIRTFAGWALIGWEDSRRVVLADKDPVIKRIALGNISTEQIHQLYP